MVRVHVVLILKYQHFQIDIDFCTCQTIFALFNDNNVPEEMCMTVRVREGGRGRTETGVEKWITKRRKRNSYNYNHKKYIHLLKRKSEKIGSPEKCFM